MNDLNAPKPLLTLRSDMSVRREVYDFGKGLTVREVVERPNAVVILALNKGKVAFVRQHRYGAGRQLLELPAGKLESEVECVPDRALIELQEEIGMTGKLVYLGGFFASPGYSTEYLSAWLATDLLPSKLEGDEEDIEVIWLTLPEINDLIKDGEIQDSKTLATLYLYEHSTR